MGNEQSEPAQEGENQVRVRRVRERHIDPGRWSRGRFFYNRREKARALRLLDMGIPCRDVARMTGPTCSSGTPIRWRKQAQRKAEAEANAKVRRRIRVVNERTRQERQRQRRNR